MTTCSWCCGTNRPSLSNRPAGSGKSAACSYLGERHGGPWRRVVFRRRADATVSAGAATPLLLVRSGTDFRTVDAFASRLASACWPCGRRLTLTRPSREVELRRRSASAPPPPPLKMKGVVGASDRRRMLVSESGRPRMGNQLLQRDPFGRRAAARSTILQETSDRMQARLRVLLRRLVEEAPGASCDRSVAVPCGAERERTV